MADLEDLRKSLSIYKEGNDGVCVRILRMAVFDVFSSILLERSKNLIEGDIYTSN